MSKSNLMHTGSGHKPLHSVNTGQARKPVHPLRGAQVQKMGQQEESMKGQRAVQPPAAPQQDKASEDSIKDKMIKAQQAASAEKIIQKQHEFEMWRIQEMERLETRMQKIRRQARQMEKERLELNIEKAHFYRQQEFEETKKKHEEHLLEMKRQILEGELYKLAEEKKQFEQKKNFYDQVESYQKDDIRTKPASIQGAIFFAGVTGQSSLKKRYKDLLKIYHPDNKCGDTDAIQEINREYQRLLAKMQEQA